MVEKFFDFIKEVFDVVARAAIITIFITLCIAIFSVAFVFVVTRLEQPWCF